MGSGRCWGRRLDSHCYFADFKIPRVISLSPLCHPFDNVRPGQNKLEHFSSRKQDRWSWRGASHREAAAEVGTGFTPFP